MNRIRFYIFNMFMLLIINTINIYSQGSDLDYAFYEAKKLKKSVLVVRVPVNAPKIRFLKSKIKEAPTEKVLSTLQQELNYCEEDNRLRFEAIKNAIKVNYKFSPVLFIADSSYIEFEKGNPVSVYGGDENEGWHVRRKPKEYYMLISGSNEDQWVIVNAELKVLDAPFPHRATVFMSGFRRVFSRQTYYHKQLSWFEKRLKNLYSGL